MSDIEAQTERVEVESWMTPAEAAERYHTTLVWDRDTSLPAGGTIHIGGGLWLTVCRACGAYSETWGAMPRHATIGRHEVDAHGLQVPGINVGLLAIR